MTNIHPASYEPTRQQERHIILDLLRGIALFGIAIANFPEFSLYSFLNDQMTAAMPTADMDRVIRYIQYILIDGKFYTMFSVLFGIGFSIILSNSTRENSRGIHIFYRRMVILFIIGMVHLMFIWSGDILALYALLGLFLVPFRHASNKRLLITAATLLILPAAMDSLRVALHWNPSSPVIAVQKYFCARYGITENNFAFWLRDAESYSDVFKFLIQGAFVRIREFIDGSRPFKAFGLFLLGFYIGKNHLYANLETRVKLLKKVFLSTAALGLPASILYAWFTLNCIPLNDGVRTTLYSLGVFPLGLSYMAGICLLFLRHKNGFLIKPLASAGQMALTNYIAQSLSGMLIFYGIGMGFGARAGLLHVVLTAMGIYLAEIIFSLIWLRYFQFGPLEWIWRILTYGKIFPLFKKNAQPTTFPCPSSENP